MIVGDVALAVVDAAWNSSALPLPVSVSAVPGVVGAALITNVVAFVIELTVALFAKPVPVSPMPTTRPVVLSQVTVVLAAVVVQFVNVMPFAVNVAVLLDAVAAALATKVVLFVIELIVAPAAMPGPVMIIPGHRFAVLLHTTLVLALVVVQFVSTTGEVRFDCRFACRVAPAPAVVHVLRPPVPFQLFDEAIAKVSRNTFAVTCAPRS